MLQRYLSRLRDLPPAACRPICLLLCLIICPAVPAHPQVLFNEYVSSNINGILDEDGDSSDWIELYNPTSGTIDLGEYFLTDSAGNLNKWPIP